MTLLTPEVQAVPVSLRPASGQARDPREAADSDGGGFVPLFVVAGLGTLLALFATLWVTARRPRRGRAS